MDRDLFKKSFLGKTIKNKGKFFDLPIREYVVTSALYQFDPGDVTVLSLVTPEYADNESQWYTLYIYPEDFRTAMMDLDILD